GLAMSLFAVPEALAGAASDVADIGSALRAAHGVAALPTTGLLAAAEDDVSAAIAALFGTYGREYQALGVRMTAFHDDFVRALSGAGTAYAAAETANARPLRDLLSVANAQSQAAFGRPLLGDGVDGTAAHPNGGAGGLLSGHGGDGYSQATAGLAG